MPGQCVANRSACASLGLAPWRREQCQRIAGDIFMFRWCIQFLLLPFSIF